MTIATSRTGGIHGPAGVARTERALKKLQGVRDAIVNFATRSARVTFDEGVVSEDALYHAITDNGYQVLRPEFAQEHKEQARREIKLARSRAFLALALAFPVVTLAMLDIELPWRLLDRNLSTWVEAILSSLVILGLGWE